MGLVVPDLLHTFFAELAVGLSGVLRRSGFSLVISSSEEDPELERQEIEHLLSRGVDALLIAYPKECRVFPQHRSQASALYPS